MRTTLGNEDGYVAAPAEEAKLLASVAWRFLTCGRRHRDFDGNGSTWSVWGHLLKRAVPWR